MVRLGLVDVAGPSMSPTLRHGDLVLVAWGARVRPGEVVLVRGPGGRPLIKRAVRPDPAGWWVLGDHPDASTDSRHFGPVGESDVLGRVLCGLRPWRSPRRLRHEGGPLSRG